MPPAPGYHNPALDAPGVGNYQYIRTLGHGNFATVKLARHARTNQEVAIKIIDKTVLQPKQLQKLYREVRILKKLNHPHIIQLYEVLESDTCLYLILEYVSGGELYDFLIVQGKMKEKEARTKFLQIMSALMYCHSRRIIHRDLKAENLLLDADLNIKVADFGFSNVYDPAGMMETFCGSPPYAAPELFQGVRYTGPEVDIWSLGIILYVMSTSCLPFDGRNFQEMKAVVCRGRFIIPDHVSDGLRALIRSMVVVDRSQRASLKAFLDDPWLNEDGPAVERLMQLGLDRETIMDQGSLLPEDADHLPVDFALVQAMSAKFSIPTTEIVEHIHTNQFDEITTTYKLMLKDRDRYVAPAKEQPLPPGGSHDHEADTGVMVTVTISEAATEDPASNYPPTPLLADLIPSSDDEDSRDQGSSETGDSVRTVLSPPQSRGRRPLAIRIPGDPSTDDSPSMGPTLMPPPTPGVDAIRVVSVRGSSIRNQRRRSVTAAPTPSDALQRLGISAGPAATEEAGHGQAALMAALLTTGRKSMDVPRPTMIPMAVSTTTDSATVGVTRSRTTAGFFGSLSAHRGSSDRASLRSASGATDDTNQGRSITPSTPLASDPSSDSASSAAPGRTDENHPGATGATGAPEPTAHLSRRATFANSLRLHFKQRGTPEADLVTSPAPAASGAPVTSGPPSATSSGSGSPRRPSILGRMASQSQHASPSSTAPTTPRSAALTSPPVSAGQSLETPLTATKPRTLHFAFSSASTSSSAPGEMMAQLVGAAKGLDLAIEPTGPYTVRLGSADSAVEAEVCRLRLFAKVHGVRFRRLAGSSEAYKTLCAQLLGAVRF